MKCVIPGSNIKVFGRAIHSLAKLGEELYIEATDQGLGLKTVNSSRSAFANFNFAPSFFTHYSDGTSNSQSDDEDEENFKCKIPIKSCLAVFKSLPTLERSVEKCKITLDDAESRLVFQMHCRHGIVKTYNLAYIECETLQAVFSKDMCPNVLLSQAKLLSEVVVNFQSNQEEVSLIVDPEKTCFKNYVEADQDHTKVIHTELTLLPEEFDNYQVGVDTEVTFCLKELRAILSFAETSNLPLSLHFESAGKPIVFAMGSDPSFEGNFVLATLAPKNGDSQNSQRMSQAPERQSVPQSAAKNAISRQRRPVAPTPKVSSVSKYSAQKKALGDFHGGGDNNDNNNTDRHRSKKVQSRVNSEIEGPCNDMEEFDRDMSSADLEAIDKAAAQHLAENSQTSSSLVNYPQLEGLGGVDTVRHPVEENDDDDLQGSPIIPVNHRLKQTLDNLKVDTNKASGNNASFPIEADSDEDIEDYVPGTPPSKKFRAMFAGLSQSTTSGSQKPSVMVLAEASDEESN